MFAFYSLNFIIQFELTVLFLILQMYIAMSSAILVL